MAGDISQFFGVEGPVTSIVNYYSAGGVQSSVSIASSDLSITKETLSGALTAGTLATVNNISGRGRVNIVTAYSKDATARTIRVQVIVDGTTVFDATSNSISTTGRGVVALGVIDNTGSASAFQPIRFNTSLVVKVASSLTETDKIATGINYELW